MNFAREKRCQWNPISCYFEDRVNCIVRRRVSLLAGFLSAIWSSLLFGQSFTLSGSVKDEYTGLPLDSALVEVMATPNVHRDIAYTDQNGEWSLVLTSVREAPGSIPATFYVFPNSPNPFHPPTQLHFSTARAGRAEIGVYNVLGQQLDVISAVLSAGEYAVPWGGKDGRGILFYSITIDGARFTGKMLQLTAGETGLGNIVRGERSLQVGRLEKPFQQEYKFVVSKFAYEPDTLVQNLSGDTRLDFVLDTIHRRALVIDLHNDVLEKVVETGYQLGPRHTVNHSDIPRFRDGGMDVQLLSIWINPTRYPTNAYQQALKFVAALDSQVARNPNDLMQVRHAAEIDQAQVMGKIAGILAVEGGHTIENSLAKLKDLHAAGARYLTITWNNSTDWAISARDGRSTTVGLSDFGKQVIQTAQSFG